MVVYVAHSRELSYEKDLYLPIRSDEELKKHKIILPHEDGKDECHSRDFYKSIDVMIAEVSAKATGLGIELGFAFDDGTPIYCLSKKGTKVSRSIRSVTNNYYEYENTEEMLRLIKNIIELEENGGTLYE